ncbi:MAG: hypothetical protein PHS44_07935 [Candidatus Dojkabacteria bacterium]|nr:hypothetical protein [Candidatus Dojkabacteria bacterium]
MNLIDHILSIVSDSKSKTLLQVGAHNDKFTKVLAKHFKSVDLFYEFIKISEKEEANIRVKKMPYADVLKSLENYDVIFMDNEFHHFPDIFQLWTYDRLQPDQILMIKEWDTQDKDPYFKCFQDCRLLHQLTREILLKERDRGRVRVEEIYQKEKYGYDSKEEMIEFFKYIYPDHWEFGEEDLMKLIEETEFPIEVDEGYYLYFVRKANSKQLRVK